jgi:hypothetical protein
MSEALLVVVNLMSNNWCYHTYNYRVCHEIVASNRYWPTHLLNDESFNNSASVHQ